MSYDLYFYREAATEFAPDAVRTYFAERSNFKVNGGPDFQAWYENKTTGVYCSFEYTQASEDDSAPTPATGFQYTGLYFNINFNRPSFFAIETMPLVEFVADRFRLLMGDPQADLEDVIFPSRLSADALVASWEKSNARAVRAIHADETEDVRYLYYPREKALYWWRYTKDEEALQERIGEDVFVPKISLVRKPNETEVRSLVVWSDALPQVFPPVDFVLLNRMTQDSSGEWHSKKTELLPWRWVKEQIRPLTEKCEGDVPGLVIVSNNNRPRLREIFNRLEGRTFKDYQFVASDGYIDVALPTRLPKGTQ